MWHWHFQLTFTVAHCSHCTYLSCNRRDMIFGLGSLQLYLSVVYPHYMYYIFLGIHMDWSYECFVCKLTLILWRWTLDRYHHDHMYGIILGIDMNMLICTYYRPGYLLRKITHSSNISPIDVIQIMLYQHWVISNSIL